VVELVYTTDLKSVAHRDCGFKSRLRYYLYERDMIDFCIYTYCRSANSYDKYMLLGRIKARGRKAALEGWRGDNPSQTRVIESSSKLKIVALVEPGGI
jgi:hypothetical protein